LQLKEIALCKATFLLVELMEAKGLVTQQRTQAQERDEVSITTGLKSRLPKQLH